MRLSRNKSTARMPAGRFGLMCFGLLAAALLPAPAFAVPRLLCEIAEGGDVRVVEVAPMAEPYDAEGVDINHRFRFKAVVVGSDRQIDYVKLYAYYWSRQQPVLLHEAKYLSPQARLDPRPDALTGTQYLYSPELGREMQYRCALREVAP